MSSSSVRSHPGIPTSGGGGGGGGGFKLDQLEWGLIIRCTAFLVIGVVAVVVALIHHYIFVSAAVDDAGDGVRGSHTTGFQTQLVTRAETRAETEQRLGKICWF